MQTIKPMSPDKHTVVCAFIEDLVCFGYPEKDIVKDILYINARSKSEHGFHEKTLPRLGKHLEACLQEGQYFPLEGFRRKPGSVLPSFLYNLHRRIFADDGILVDVGDEAALAIKLIRQLAYILYKMEAIPTESQMDEAIEGFLKTEVVLDKVSYGPEVYGYLDLASHITRDVMQGFSWRDIAPRPGPGATADKVKRQHRYQFKIFYPPIHAVYDYRFYGTDDLTSAPKTMRVLKKHLPLESEGICELLGVPKDSRGPRLICEMPHDYMLFQNGIADEMRAHIEASPITGGQVNFELQSINAELALTSSISGQWVTLDMKEASDNILRDVVADQYQLLPELWTAMDAVSPSLVRFMYKGSERIVRVKKFAPMGSSLCFPVMSLLHYALAVSAIHLDAGIPLEDAYKLVFVYGDDIICRPEHAEILFDVFPKFGMIFNRQKSFTKGFFRESCGCDAFNGVDVTPVKIKKWFDGSPEALASAIEVTEALNAYPRLSKYLKAETERIWGKLPTVHYGCGALGWHSATPSAIGLKGGRKTIRGEILDFQAFWIKARELSTKSVSLDGFVALSRMKMLRSPLNCTSVGLRDAVTVKWRWFPIYENLKPLSKVTVSPKRGNDERREFFARREYVRWLRRMTNP